MHKPYKPTMTDIVWLSNLLSSIKDGGYWASPSAGLVFRIDKTNKVAEMSAVNAEDLEGEQALIHTEVFKALTWTVVTEKESHE